MTTDKKESEGNFEIRCISCGARIRRDNYEDSHGVCLKCFYQVLNERFRAQRRARLGEVVSDR